MINIPFAVLFALLVLRCLRIYFRTGLNAELVQAAGILIVIASFSLGGVMLPIVGCTVFNVGLMIAVTFEVCFGNKSLAN